MKIPTIQLDAENQRVFPDPLMPIANSTKITWTLIWISFVVSYLVGVYFKNKKQFKNAVSISWVLLPLLIFSWIFKKPLIDLNELIRNDIPVFIGFLLICVLTIYFINNKIVNSKMILWNGPVGAFEFKPYDKATNAIANVIKVNAKKLNINTLAGGGDTVSAIKNTNAEDGFRYISNAGGAFLEWLEGNESPGVRSLKENKRLYIRNPCI